MFGKNNPQQQFGPPPGGNYYLESQVQRLYYEVQENKRKIKNLNRRVRRIENYLNIRKEDTEEEYLDN